jgi:tRNA(fMet)-specific endonuclease VapC
MERQRILIDTSILIDYLRRTKKESTLFVHLSTQYEFAISTITEFEFLIGSTDRNRSFIEAVIQHLLVLPFDSSCVSAAVEIYRSLKSSSRLLPLPDIAIAATAISHRLPLATLNTEHFRRISALTLLGEEPPTGA